jgi:hypothetical protein
MSNNPLNQARELILKFSATQDAQEKISSLKNLPPDKLNKQLEEYYSQAEDLAFQGNIKEISIMLRVQEHFNDRSHDRMLLHYIAQAAANNALAELRSEAHPNYQDMKQALTLISKAFEYADKIDDSLK